MVSVSLELSASLIDGSPGIQRYRTHANWESWRPWEIGNLATERTGSTGTLGLSGIGLYFLCSMGIKVHCFQLLKLMQHFARPMHQVEKGSVSTRVYGNLGQPVCKQQHRAMPQYMFDPRRSPVELTPCENGPHGHWLPIFRHVTACNTVAAPTIANDRVPTGRLVPRCSPSVVRLGACDRMKPGSLDRVDSMVFPFPSQIGCLAPILLMNQDFKCSGVPRLLDLDQAGYHGALITR